MKTPYFVYIPIVLLVFAVLAVGFIIFMNNDDAVETADTAVDQEITDYHEFTSVDGDDYIYYSRSQDAISEFQSDCEERNGEFNECGSSCSLQGGEICPSVCDILCKLN